MTIRAIAFDAVGTLLHPVPSAWEVYSAVGERFGSRLTLAEIKARFLTAFAEQERCDAVTGWRTDEELAERRRWQEIVAAVLDDVADPADCFTALYEHFAQPSAWQCLPEVAEVLTTLQRRGFALALASNFDHRLRAVAVGLPALAPLVQFVISSEVGWRKPAPRFFTAVAERLHLPLAEVLFVGDDLTNDYEGACGVGMPTLLVDRAGKRRDLGERRLDTLGDLLQRIQLNDVSELE